MAAAAGYAGTRGHALCCMSWMVVGAHRVTNGLLSSKHKQASVNTECAEKRRFPAATRNLLTSPSGLVLSTVPVAAMCLSVRLCDSSVAASESCRSKTSWLEQTPPALTV